MRLWAACLSLLALPSTTYAGSREAVQKAIAATVAVEWRAKETAARQQAQAEGAATAARFLADGEKSAQQQAEAERDTARRRLTKTASEAGDADPRPRMSAMRWRRAPHQVDLALASGVVVSADGLVVTLNREPEGHHVVVLADGRSLPARVLVDDRRSGLRLLKVDAADLPHLALADGDAEVGDQVFAAFCTDRHERAAAQGMVAARPKAAALELDLATGPMSAGGALVSEQGKLVGIISEASGARTQTSNSAVRLNDVRALLAAQQGENTVVVHRGFLGLSLESKPEGGREHVIVRLVDDSPARAAGVLDGDELVAIAGEKVGSPEEAVTFVARHAPGEKLRVAVLRDGQQKDMEIVLGRPPAALESSQAGATQAGNQGPGGVGTASIVHPEQVYVVTEDGKKIALVTEGEHLDALRGALRLRRAVSPYQKAAEPAVRSIRVERSDLDKRLEDVGRSVESLQEQIKKLSEEIQSLRSKLAETK